MGALLSCVFVSPATGQSTSPVKVNLFLPVDCVSTEANADSLASLYYKGNASATNNAFLAALSGCGLDSEGKDGRPALNGETDYVLVTLLTTFGSTKVSSGGLQPQLLHFMAHRGNADYRLILPGVKSPTRVFQVVLYAPVNFSFASSATETKVASPLTTDLAAFLKQVSLAGYYIRPQFVPEVNQPSGTKLVMRAQVGTLPIRFHEASVSLTEAGRISPSDELTGDDIVAVKKAIARVQLVFNGLGKALPSCISVLSDAIYNVVANTPWAGSRWDDLPKAVDHGVTAFLCPSGGLTAGEIDTVRSRYLAAVAAPSSTDVSGSATIMNAPLVRFRYGAMLAALVGPARPADQVKPNSDSKVYDADPIGRAMTMAAVSLYPFPYDSTSATMTLQERLSVDAGPILTPSAGIGVGLSIGLARGLAFSGGSAWVVAGRGPGGQRPGDAIPASGRTLTQGVAQSFYLGMRLRFP
ncbi:MAG: hypothetical protein ABI625_08805 [bacterium]